MGILKQAEGGMPVSELCREHEMSSASFYKWRAEFGGTDASLIGEMKDMAEQNWRLKKIYVEMSMQNNLLKEALGKSVRAVSQTRDGHKCSHKGGRQYRACLPHLPNQ